MMKIKGLLKQKIILFAIIILIMAGCIHSGNSSSNTKNRYSLKDCFYSKSIDGELTAYISDSCNTISVSLNFMKNKRKQKIIRTFIQKSGLYYEQKLIGDTDNNIVDTVYILAFALKDTSLKYLYNYDKYPSVMPEGLDDWEYSISSIGNKKYRLKKTHIKDSSFIEEYVYDSNFILYQVNLFQGSDTLMFDR